MLKLYCKYVISYYEVLKLCWRCVKLGVLLQYGMEHLVQNDTKAKQKWALKNEQACNINHLAEMLEKYS